MLIPAALVRACTAALTCGLLAPAGAAAADGEATPLGLEGSGGKAAESAGAGGGGIVRTIVGLAVVIGVIYGLTWILRQVKSSREAGAEGTGLERIATLPLGPNRSLHLVRAGDEIVLVGASESGVTPIRTYTEAEARDLGLVVEPAHVIAVPAEDAGSRLQRAVEELRRRTVIK